MSTSCRLPPPAPPSSASARVPQVTEKARLRFSGFSLAMAAKSTPRSSCGSIGQGSPDWPLAGFDGAEEGARGGSGRLSTMDNVLERSRAQNSYCKRQRLDWKKCSISNGATPVRSSQRWRDPARKRCTDQSRLWRDVIGTIPGAVAPPPQRCRRPDGEQCQRHAAWAVVDAGDGWRSEVYLGENGGGSLAMQHFQGGKAVRPGGRGLSP